MKKLFALIITAALILSFAACGGSGKNDPSEPDAKDTDAQVSQSEAGTEDAAGEPSAEQPDDYALIEAEKAKLTGKWTMNGVEEISLVFNEDGTGRYTFMSDKNIGFTYVVSVSHETYGNGAAYNDFLLNMTYETGEVEDIIFFFNEETGNLAFHNSENGGYSGVIDYAEWTRK